MNTTSVASVADDISLALTDHGRLYALEGEGPVEQLHVERWSSERVLSSCGALVIDALSLDADLVLDEALGTVVALHMVRPDGSRSRQSGVVQEAKLVGADGSLARYRLRLVPWLWLASEGRHSRVFQETTVPDILDDVFSDYTGYAAWRIAPDAREQLTQGSERSFTVQYRESDLDFVERLLAEEGLGYAFVEDDEAPAGHVLVIFGDSSQLPENNVSAGSLDGIRFHRAASVEEADAIQSFGPRNEIGPSSVNLLAWGYQDVAASGGDQPGWDLPGTGEAYDSVGTDMFADRREAQHYARTAGEAHEIRQRRWIGRGTVRGASPGTRFRIAQTPWQITDQTMPEGFLWTHLVEVGINNLSASVRRQAQQQLGDVALPHAAEDALWSQADATGYAQHFEAVDQTLPWRPVLADEHGIRQNPRPTVPGTQTATVVGPEGETEPGASGPLYTDAMGRLKVRFHWMQAGASCWLRSTERYAGSEHGAQFLPRIGQEVLVNFVAGDIDQPVIVGSVYNGQGEGAIAASPGKPERAVDAEVYTAASDQRTSAQGNLTAGNSPAWHGQSGDEAGHANAAALSGIRTNAFDDHGSNELVFDDTDEQGRMRFASTQSASALSLGHLIHQADNYRGSFRGTGLELRTDAQGAVRGRQGLLVNTYGQMEDEPVGDATAIGALLQQHGQLSKTLSGAAKNHESVALTSHEGVDGAQQCRLSGEAAPLQALHTSAIEAVSGDDYVTCTKGAGDASHSRDALALVGARGGFGMLAGQSLHFACDETFSLGSAQHVNMAVAEQLRVHAGQGIGVVAGATGGDSAGLDMVASNGPVAVSAMSDRLALRASDDVNLASASADVSFEAGDTIQISNTQGACLTIDDSGITFACPGKLAVKAAQHNLTG